MENNKKKGWKGCMVYIYSTANEKREEIKAS